MNKKYTFVTGLGTLALLIGLFIPAAFVHAVTQPAAGSGQALEIAPPVLNLTADPGQTIKTQISLRDISSGKLVVTAQVNDFVASGEDGTPKILLDDSEPNPYSMKNWITSLPSFTLSPRQIQNLPLTIKVPVNASPGGYYGVIRFTGTPPDIKETGVSLSASLGSLILLRVNGAVAEKLNVAEFSVNNGGESGSLFESTPIKFVERLKNDGNIHEQPTGLVTIKDMFGKKLATLTVNAPPRNILPHSIRKFEQPLDTTVIGNKQLFGRYTAEMSVTYGTNKQVVTSSLSFWIIPYRLIAAAIIALIVGFIVLRAAIKRYNRHIIGKATGTGKAKKRR